MKTCRLPLAQAVACMLVLMPAAAHAFCGFYVAKADATLYNEASRVVLVRDGDRTVLTMVNDYKGDPTEFALVVPVPTFIERGQINVGDMAVVDHLDAYSAPRLVEYFDHDPCTVVMMRGGRESADALATVPSSVAKQSSGVTIEATYTVGEYDILILSASQSQGLETWLRENGYNLPDGASEVLGSYIKQGMRFFVAKVNLGEQQALGYNYLRPLQVAFESRKFMLPIRLGTVNASGPQDLLIYALTRTGRVETTNYRTVKLPTGDELPAFVKDDFESFYLDMFKEQVRKHSMSAVFTEYAWDMAWCDPCAADPLNAEQLRSLGVYWVGDNNRGGRRPGDPRIMPPSKGGAQDVFVTRLHVRYDGEHFPDDLVFHETGDRQNFQGRYVIRHAWDGNATCDAARNYRASLRERQEREALRLAALTGWRVGDIRQRMELGASGTTGSTDDGRWWERLWR